MYMYISSVINYCAMIVGYGEVLSLESNDFLALLDDLSLSSDSDNEEFLRSSTIPSKRPGRSTIK